MKHYGLHDLVLDSQNGGVERRHGGVLEYHPDLIPARVASCFAKLQQVAAIEDDLPSMTFQEAPQVALWKAP